MVLFFKIMPPLTGFGFVNGCNYKVKEILVIHFSSDKLKCIVKELHLDR